MLDLETLAYGANAIILSIGVCEFDPMTGEIGRRNEFNIDLQSSIEAGRSTSAEVLKWWLEQSSEAQAAAFEGTMEFKSALECLSNWMPFGPIVWGNGPSFDIAKLELAYEQLFGEESYPWNFRDTRCVRTMRDLTEGLIDRDDIPFVGEKHSALADAIWQAKYVSKMYQMIKDKLTNV